MAGPTFRLKEVISYTGLSRSAVYDRMNENSPRYDASFPKRFPLGGSAVGWFKDDIDAWLKNCALKNLKETSLDEHVLLPAKQASIKVALKPSYIAHNAQSKAELVTHSEEPVITPEPCISKKKQAPVNRSLSNSDEQFTNCGNQNETLTQYQGLNRSKPTEIIEYHSWPKMFFEPTESVRISKAAEELSTISKNISVDDLLNMGILGKAEIMAPVVSEGIFEWPRQNAILFFPEINQPIRQIFNSSDRVILLKEDLAKIEAVGWTIPNAFFAPSIAQKAIEYYEFCMPNPLWENCELSTQRDTNTTNEIINILQTNLSESDEPDSIVTTITKYTGKSQKVKSQSLTLREITNEAIKYVKEGTLKSLKSAEIKKMRECIFQTTWCAVNPLEADSERTTIDHLFISAKEVDRLQAVLKNN